jgi:hypothetical protein
VYYSVGFIGVLISIFALTSQSEKRSVEVKIQSLKYEIDNIADRLRSDKVSTCSLTGETGQTDAQDCFAYSMALIIFDIWRQYQGFPFTDIPSCEQISQYLENNDEIFGISSGYQSQWVSEHVGVEALHPLCVSEKHYKTRYSLTFDPSSIRSVIFHISQLMPCYYPGCQVFVFRPYDIELNRIDVQRDLLADRAHKVGSVEKLSTVSRWLGLFLIGITLSLRLTKTSTDLFKE